MIKQITEEPMEWQAALGLREEPDLGERKKDDPPQPQQSIELGNTLAAVNSTSVLGADGNHVPLLGAAALVDHAELQTQVCRKGTSGIN